MSIYRVMSFSNYDAYVNKQLFLTNKNKSRLLESTDKSANILLKLNYDGSLVVNEITNSTILSQNMSLRSVGAKYLDLVNPSWNDVIKYLVTPEMEIERIFNNLRFKYLKAIYLSNFENPQKYIKYTYNKAFQTLTGLTIYQGKARQRKINDSFWKDAGFTIEAREQNWENERDDMQRVVSMIKRINTKPMTKPYAELIAIKPGFHELYLHGNYFETSSIPKGTSPRDQVFRILRNAEDISSLAIDSLPSEINKNSYISYAPCNVTEGPFVFRKKISVNYCEEIRCIKSKDQLDILNDKFHILDYYNRDVSTRDKLKELLELAEPFCKFMT